MLTISLHACFSPKPVVRLAPHASNEHCEWFLGKQFVHVEQDGIAISFAYDRADDAHLILDFEVSNYSDEVILIDPGRFYYTLSSRLDDPKKGESNAIRKKAIDPENKILEIDLESSRLEANRKNKQVLLASLAAVATVATVAAISKDEKKGEKEKTSYHQQNQQRKQEIAGAWADLMIGTAFTSDRVNFTKAKQQGNLRNLRQNWEQIPLRKTHLYPQESIAGKILYERDLKSNMIYARFFFPIGQTRAAILFNRKIYKPGQ